MASFGLKNQKKKEKEKKNEKKKEEKKGRKRKRGLKEVPSETGRRIDFFLKEMLREIVTTLRPPQKIRFWAPDKDKENERKWKKMKENYRKWKNEKWKEKEDEWKRWV